MICIFAGSGPNIDVGVIQAAVEAQVASCEHDPEVQERQDGYFNLQRRAETIDEVNSRLASENRVGVAAIEDMRARGVGGLDTTPRQVLTGVETRRAAAQQLMVSSNLVKDDSTSVTLADFPDGWSFGNGVTCNSDVTFKDGTRRIVSWVVFPDAAELTVRSAEALLRQLMEG